MLLDPHHDQMVDVERSLETQIIPSDAERPVEQIALQRFEQVVLEEQQLAGRKVLVLAREPGRLDLLPYRGPRDVLDAVEKRSLDLRVEPLAQGVCVEDVVLPSRKIAAVSTV